MDAQRRPSETDVRFQQLLEASPLPKSVLRLRDKLQQQTRQGSAGALNASPAADAQLEAALDDGGDGRDSRDSDDGDDDARMQLESSPARERASSPAKRQATAGSSADVAGRVAPRAPDARDVTPSDRDKDKDGDEIATSSTSTTPQRRKSARRSGPRDYWVLGSTPRAPVYNETAKLRATPKPAFEATPKQ
ncbi:hypothetical protein Dda_8423 [Drechslerella dactyloides]|uniref:Uncharacterized protein n=1 Tax=Drechslerella dactyloides TaxID=74499 RepID=A0AAD6IS39_DREDA|nr:hypothetical protein Dda_8423 [Drechslerella dactyloides]